MYIAARKEFDMPWQRTRRCQPQGRLGGSAAAGAGQRAGSGRVSGGAVRTWAANSSYIRARVSVLRIIVPQLVQKEETQVTSATTNQP